MERLKPQELSKLREFVGEVLTVCENDDTFVTVDLYDLALQAAEILGIKFDQKEE